MIVFPISGRTNWECNVAHSLRMVPITRWNNDQCPFMSGLNDAVIAHYEISMEH